MNTIDNPPSLLRIISVDYAAFTGFLYPPLCWAVFIIMTILESTDFSRLVWIGAAITAVGIPLLLWRFQLIRSVFSEGLETPGEISSVSFFRDRGRVSYIYTYQGEKFISSNAVMKTKRTRALQVGDPVTVMVGRDNPKKAFIRQLYQ